MAVAFDADSAAEAGLADCAPRVLVVPNEHTRKTAQHGIKRVQRQFNGEFI
jgi:hypothetical protein